MGTVQRNQSTAAFNTEDNKMKILLLLTLCAVCLIGIEAGAYSLARKGFGTAVSNPYIKRGMEKGADYVTSGNIDKEEACREGLDSVNQLVNVISGLLTTLQRVQGCIGYFNDRAWTFKEALKAFDLATKGSQGLVVMMNGFSLTLMAASTATGPALGAAIKGFKFLFDMAKRGVEAGTRAMQSINAYTKPLHDRIAPIISFIGGKVFHPIRMLRIAFWLTTQIADQLRNCICKMQTNRLRDKFMDTLALSMVYGLEHLTYSSTVSDPVLSVCDEAKAQYEKLVEATNVEVIGRLKDSISVFSLGPIAEFLFDVDRVLNQRVCVDNPLYGIARGAVVVGEAIGTAATAAVDGIRAASNAIENAQANLAGQLGSAIASTPLVQTAAPVIAQHAPAVINHPVTQAIVNDPVTQVVVSNPVTQAVAQVVTSNPVVRSFTQPFRSLFGGRRRRRNIFMAKHAALDFASELPVRTRRDISGPKICVSINDFLNAFNEFMRPVEFLVETALKPLIDFVNDQLALPFVPNYDNLGFASDMRDRVNTMNSKFDAFQAFFNPNFTDVQIPSVFDMLIVFLNGMSSGIDKEKMGFSFPSDLDDITLVRFFNYALCSNM